MAIIGSGSSIGSIISPALGGWVGEQFGLRAVYLGAGIAFTLSTMALWPLSGQPVHAASLVRTAPKQLLSNRRFIWQIVFIFLLFFAIELGPVMTPKFLEDVRGLSVGQIGWLGTISSLGVVLLSLVLGHMPVDRRGSLLFSQAVALAAMILWVSTPVRAFILLAYFIHGSNRVVRPVVIGRLARSLDAATLSFGYGFYETAMRLGLAIAPGVAGLLYERGPAWPLYAGAAAVSVTMLLTFTLPGAPAAVLAVERASSAALPDSMPEGLSER